MEAILQFKNLIGAILEFKKFWGQIFKLNFFGRLKSEATTWVTLEAPFLSPFPPHFSYPKQLSLSLCVFSGDRESPPSFSPSSLEPLSLPLPGTPSLSPFPTFYLYLALSLSSTLYG